MRSNDNQEQKSSKTWRPDPSIGHIIAFFLLIMAAVVALFGVERNIPFLSYPAAAIGLSGVAYLVTCDNISPSDITTSSKIPDTVLWTSLVVLVTLGRSTSGIESLPTLYYLLLIGFLVAIAVRIWVWGGVMPIAQLLVFTLATRIIVATHATRVGTDTLFHTAIVDYILQTGTTIPASASYYHHFPGAHYVAATIAEVLSVDATLSFFIAVSVANSLSLPVIGIVTQRLLPYETNYRIPAFAVWFVATSANMFLLGSLYISQTLSVVFILFSMWLFLQDFGTLRVAGMDLGSRNAWLVLLIFVASLQIHNLTPVIIGLTACCIFIAKSVIGMITDRNQQYSRITNYIIPLFAAIGYFGYITTDYFRFIAHRLYAVINLATSTSVEPLGSSIPSTELFGIIIPPIIELGASPLLRGIFISMSALFMLDRLYKNSEHNGKTILITLTAVFLFGAVFILFVSGGQHGARAFPALAIVTAPICAHQLYRLFGGRRIVGPVMALLLVSAGGWAMVSNGSANALETTEYKPVHEEGTVAAVNWANNQTQVAYAPRWTQRVAEYEGWRRGNAESDNIKLYAQSANVSTSTIQEFSIEHPNELFILKQYFRKSKKVNIPLCNDIVYQSGSASVLRSCD